MTEIYVKTLLPLFAEHAIDGLAHITGGGISENITRVLANGLGLEIDLSSWEFPACFDWLQTQGQISEAEMLRTFNCGIGMTILVADDVVEGVCTALSNAGEQVIRMGKVVNQSGGQRVSYHRS